MKWLSPVPIHLSSYLPQVDAHIPRTPGSGTRTGKTSCPTVFLTQAPSRGTTYYLRTGW